MKGYNVGNAIIKPSDVLRQFYVKKCTCGTEFSTLSSKAFVTVNSSIINMEGKGISTYYYCSRSCFTSMIQSKIWDTPDEYGMVLSIVAKEQTSFAPDTWNIRCKLEHRGFVE